MRLTTRAATLPRLSCYSTNLVACLEQDDPDIRRRIGHAVRLAVRTDLPAGELAFVQHTPVDATADGRTLAYRGSPEWSAARAGLITELACRDSVLAVGNTAQLSWSPGYGHPGAPHWLLLHEYRDGCWLVADHFSALTPHGEQEPYLSWLEDAELARALTPLPAPAPEVVRRDALALGRAVQVPPPGHYRWLTRAAEPTAPDQAQWTTELAEALGLVHTALTAQPAAAGRYADDLWAAGRHYAHRYIVLVADDALDPRAAVNATAAWGELAKTLRFAARSAERGRPRTGVVDQAFAHLLRALPQDG
ncbi:hypothetical protein P3T36_002707 [Kitasatospora sp. MAP12-15]|uniref:hypothetical protein n=1 Tax=unclassified Kitasatospora TaxID=2633591 RepID=UPI0024769B97|nr:hypothetical protein [Kitasatospora sp. MAP12-44]MDH6113886.1 hypothetical protein [Kitasatospora sp. MAP12-44]